MGDEEESLTLLAAQDLRLRLRHLVVACESSGSSIKLLPTARRVGHFPLPKHSAFVTGWVDGSDSDYNLSTTNTCFQRIQCLIQTF